MPEFNHRLTQIGADFYNAEAESCLADDDFFIADGNIFNARWNLYTAVLDFCLVVSEFGLESGCFDAADNFG